MPAQRAGILNIDLIMADYILSIETATKNCSVALGKNEQVLETIEYAGESYSHAEKLHVFIDQILAQHQLKIQDLKAVAISMGPGSYTGLRIGVSAAKGLAYAAELPLIAVSTLESLAHKVKIKQGYIIPLIDARRLEVYSAVFDASHHLIRPVKADLLDQNPYEEYLAKKSCVFIGDAIEKTKTVIQHPNAHFFSEKYPSAQELHTLAYKKFLNKDFENLAYFEPFYLKDFIVTRKKNI